MNLQLRIILKLFNMILIILKLFIIEHFVLKKFKNLKKRKKIINRHCFYNLIILMFYIILVAYWKKEMKVDQKMLYNALIKHFKLMINTFQPIMLVDQFQINCIILNKLSQIFQKLLNFNLIILYLYIIVHAVCAIWESKHINFLIFIKIFIIIIIFNFFIKFYLLLS